MDRSNGHAVNRFLKIKSRITMLTLKDLEPGDIFVHAKAKKSQQRKFIVYGNSQFNIRHGGATRMCRTLKGDAVSKSCRLQVTKVGESPYKEKIMEMFKPMKI